MQVQRNYAMFYVTFKSHFLVDWCFLSCFIDMMVRSCVISESEKLNKKTDVWTQSWVLNDLSPELSIAVIVQYISFITGLNARNG